MRQYITVLKRNPTEKKKKSLSDYLRIAVEKVVGNGQEFWLPKIESFFFFFYFKALMFLHATRQLFVRRKTNDALCLSFFAGNVCNHLFAVSYHTHLFEKVHK